MKLPEYNADVVRACKDEDRISFKIGEVFMPGFHLTTSADLEWKDESRNRYKITPLSTGSAARAIFEVYNHGNESQVTFLQNSRFEITDIRNWGDGKTEVLMREILVADAK